MKSDSTNSYVYFSLKGDDFDPDTITEKLEIIPTKSCKKGDKGQYIKELKFAFWNVCSSVSDNLNIENLIENVVEKLFNKIEIINSLKTEYNLTSVLEVVLYVDTNEEKSTPSLSFNSKIIEFLHQTKTETDVDIYRFSSENPH